MDTYNIIFRVSVICLVFAILLFLPLKTRFRYNYFKTALLTFILLVVTVGVTVIFFVHDGMLHNYSNWGIALWIIIAILVFHTAIKGSTFEVLFIVLVVLNLYVNIAAIARVILDTLAIDWNMSYCETLTALCLIILALCVPLIWFLMIKLYKPVIEFQIDLPIWKFIWTIPALTYVIYFVKIINDYWDESFHTDQGDLIFITVWSFTSYIFFCVVLLLVMQTYKGLMAMEKSNLITAQLKMQEEQYKKVLITMEKTARLRHDWRHHLLSINGFAKEANIEELQTYLNDLMPEYSSESETPVCANAVVNIILQHNMSNAKTMGITMNIKADISQTISISDTDLCVVFGNLVENAMEACAKQTDDHKQIEIKAETLEKQLVLLIKNTYEEAPILKKGIYYSTKHEGAGIGLSSVNRIVEKNKGYMRIDCDENYFTVYVLLNAEWG
ncbi:MAG: GHKL domain-containing protein [Clostridium sp.]